MPPQPSDSAPPGSGTSPAQQPTNHQNPAPGSPLANKRTQQTTVNITSLSVPQLRALQSRLTSELEHLTTSHAKLRAAQSKFRDCIRSINDGVVGSEKKGTDGKDEILVPLTSSLYVKGRLTERGKVLVDVGTGFYVEKVGGDILYSSLFLLASLARVEC